MTNDLSSVKIPLLGTTREIVSPRQKQKRDPLRSAVTTDQGFTVPSRAEESLFIVLHGKS